MSLNKMAQWLKKLIEPFSRVVNSVGVAFLVAMMLLTTVDVGLRYALNRPITGSYELTQFMMTILVAFGLAYTAVHKGHINVDMVIIRLSPRVQAVTNATTCLLSLGVFALVAWQSIKYGESLRLAGLTSAQLLVPIYPFVFVIAFGSILLCLVFVYNLLEYLGKVVEGSRWKVWLGSLVIIILVVILFSIPIWWDGIRGQISPITAGFIGTAILVLVLFSGMVIGIVMALAGFLGMAYVVGLGPAFTSIGTSPFSTASSYSLSVIPLFVLMGLFCFYSGLSKDLYYTMYKWLGHLPGGLAMATIGACAGFAAVSGSSLACAATMGTVALPEMKKYKYDPALATGCVCAGGCLGILIPPSIILAIYGILTEQSIGKLFIAGIVPGIIEAIFFILTIYLLCKRNPLVGPPGEVSAWRDRIISLKDTWGTLLLFLLVIGGLYIGVFTPTEAAGVGAFGAFIIALGRRQLNWRKLNESLLETGKMTAMSMVILIGSIIFGYFLAVTRLPAALSDYVVAAAVDRYIVMAGIIILYLFLGCIISSMAMIILTVPIFFPVITALGFDPIWFGIIIVKVVEIGQLTPPVGLNVFVIYGIARDVPMYTIFRGIVPFFIADLAEVALLVIVPQIVTFLPQMMK